MAGLEDMLLGGSDDDSSGDEEAVEQSGVVAAPAAAAAPPAPVAAPAPAPAPVAAAASSGSGSSGMPAPSPRGGKGGKNLAAAKARADAKAAAEKQKAAAAAAAAPAPGSAPAPGAAPASGPGQSEMTRRLKSLYGPAAEAHQQQAQQAAQQKAQQAAAAAAAQQKAAQKQQQPQPAAARRAAPHPGAPIPAAPSAPAAGPGASSLVANMDIEPTSLSTIRQKQQQQQARDQARARQQQQQQLHHHNHPTPSQQQHGGGGGGGSRRSSGGGGSSSIGSGSEGGGGGGRSSSAYPPQYSQQQQQQQQQQPGGGPSRYHGGSGSSMSSSSGAPRDVHQQQQEVAYQEKKKKEQFLMFTRVLMKYLESKDAAMHQQAKQVIKVCAERNKQGDPKFASLTSSMREQLRQVVGEQYWRKAEDYLKHFLQTKGAEQAKRAMALSHGGGGGSGGGSGGRGGGQPRSSSQQQQQPQQRPGMGSGGPMRSPPSDYVPQQQRPMPAQSKSKAGSAVALTSQQKKAEEKKREQEKALRQAKTQKGKAQQKGSGSADTKKAASQQAQTEIQKAAQLLNMRQRGMTPPANLGAAAAALLAGGKTSGGSSVASASSYGDKQTLELMEHLDHAVIYDQASCSILLSKDYREDIDIQREQKKLLFGDGNSLGKVIRVPPSAGNSAAVIAGAQVGDTEKPSLYKGWSSRNIVSARIAWAKVRLPENEAASSPDRPLLPGEKDPAPIAVESADAVETTSTAVGAPYEWFNEIRTEEDETLTLLSEATEMYVRSLLEGSINQARQRQNLDGVRLWYQQHNGATKAPLCLRLGCDVKRQEALATGNAAMTVKRMEEALDRQKLPQNERNLNSNETLYKATSMSDLAKRPRLARAPERAEFDAKRSFEEYSGKNSGAPPLGRVPKKVKIVKKDITSCVQDPHFPWKRKRTVAANI